MKAREILVALRRIMRAIDLRSKQLEREEGLTVPQLLVLQVLDELGECAVGEIARRISLSQGTVTSIIKRLEFKGLVKRERGASDRRKVGISLTLAGSEQIANAPELLQESFIARFEALEPWERKMLTASVERVADLMDAETVDASPILEVGEIVEAAEESDPPLREPARERIRGGS